MDQAETLRKLGESSRAAPGPSPFILAVTSGKGGVGKSNVVSNLSCTLAQLGLSVLVMDADMGLGNIDILLGLTPSYNMEHVLNGQMRAKDILVEGPGGVRILAASSGVQELTNLTVEQKMVLVSELETMMDGVDVFLIDTGAGISSNVMYFNAMAQEVLIVVTPEPASITDAYALMKVSAIRYGGKRFKILLNTVKNQQEAHQIFSHLSMVTQRFLNLSLDMYGYVPLDPNVLKAIRQQKPVVQVFPHSQASRQFQQLAQKVREEMRIYRSRNTGGGRMFWRDFLNHTGPRN